LAGGLGSRLGFTGPKGLFPVLNKTLFQHHLEKIPATMPVAIMTSPQNTSETKAYFEKNAFFGRKILFFEQTVLPLLDEKYRPVGSGPDGNGSVYSSLLRSGVLDEFERSGVCSVFLIPIENPIADPVDGRLLGLKAEVAIKCVKRIPGESMGAVTEDLSIIEYFEIGEDHFSYSYVGQLALSMPFLRKAAGLCLPLHWVRKKAIVGGREMVVWKREKFLFDAFPWATEKKALCYEREECYGPIKGPEEKEAVENMLRKKV
jgi:putative uridylyltransferase